ncbi:hypothetical protein OAP63_09395 [Vibrio sp.]|nr:hypothetical protein [Vibrio viridaestus]MDC0610940.1 hypothetical protein [Vibrio sp.]
MMIWTFPLTLGVLFFHIFAHKGIRYLPMSTKGILAMISNIALVSAPILCPDFSDVDSYAVFTQVKNPPESYMTYAMTLLVIMAIIDISLFVLRMAERRAVRSRG